MKILVLESEHVSAIKGKDNLQEYTKVEIHKVYRNVDWV